jgi:hypothetical protein
MTGAPFLIYSYPIAPSLLFEAMKSAHGRTIRPAGEDWDPFQVQSYPASSGMCSFSLFFYNRR